MKKTVLLTLTLILLLAGTLFLLGCTENKTDTNTEQTFEECMQDCVKNDTPKNCIPICNEKIGDTNKPLQNNFCGNGVCDTLEQQRPQLCPKDCDITLAGTQYVCENGTYNPTTGYCEIILGTNYTCTNGTYDQASGKCIIQPGTQIICNEGFYNDATGNCEIIVDTQNTLCTQGIYNVAAGTCIYDSSTLTCSQQNGNICTTNQTCNNGNYIVASNSTSCCNSTCENAIASVDYDNSPFGYLRAPNLEDYVNDLGVKWVRASAQWGNAQPTNNQADFINQNKFDWNVVEENMNIKEYQEKGMNFIITLSQLGVVERGAQSYIPNDPPYTIETWKTFVKAVVERYDGDGINDSPNLVNPVKLFQVENEPKISTSGFAELQRVTYQAIKEACPDCKVLMGGVGGKNAEELENTAKNILAELNGNYIDIFDMHYWGTALDYKTAANGESALFHARELFNEYGFGDVPIWVTETGTYSGDPSSPIQTPYQTETEQAASLLKRYIYLTSHDVEKVFYAWGLYEGLHNDGTLFDFTGLIYDGQFNSDLGDGVKKLGYYTYKKMTEKLEGSDWDNIEVVQESNDIYIYKFTKNNKPIWVVWNDGAEKTITLDVGNVGTVTITSAIPKYETGQEVTNYLNAFNTQTQNPQSGKINLTVKNIPIFVEPCITNCETTVTPLSSFHTDAGFQLGFMNIENEELNSVNDLGSKWMRKNYWFSAPSPQAPPTLGYNVTYNGINLGIMNTIATIEALNGKIPSDYTKFKDKLREIVNRDKGQVKYWQIGNEPDLIWTQRNLTKEDYIKFFNELQPIIRSECPDCKIVLAGISNQYDSGNNYNYFKDVIAEIKKVNSKPFDVFDMHFYPFEGENAQTAAQTYKTMLDEAGYNYDIEYISTEVGMYSSTPTMPSGFSNVSETEQAKILVETYVEFFGGGVEKVLWNHPNNSYRYLYDRFSTFPTGYIFDLCGLVYTGNQDYAVQNNLSYGTKKESYYSFKTLVSKLNGKTDVQELAKGIYLFSKGNEKVYVAWNESQNALPTSISGTLKVTDYLGNETTKNASEIVLTNMPIFLEEV